MHGGDRLAQFQRLPVRIDLQMIRRLPEGLDSLGAGPERRLVGGQLEDPRNAGRMFLAGHIGGDVQDSRTRNRLVDDDAHGIDLLERYR